MLKMLITPEENDEPPSRPVPQNAKNFPPVLVEGLSGNTATGTKEPANIFQWINSLMKGKSDHSLREAIEEYIEESGKNGEDVTPSSVQERTLLANILSLRDTSVIDLMIPRADIVAIDVNASRQELLSVLAKHQHSRFPVYRETLDDVLGTIHIKDILACLAAEQEINIESLVREVPVISPAISVTELMLIFRQERKHMALVVDEFGGIDGLVAMGDVIGAVLGDIDDEYDTEQESLLLTTREGYIIADGRVDLEEFEEKFGQIFSEEEREEIDTLGGLAFSLAGHVPVKGEKLSHRSGMVIEILKADTRRGRKLMIRHLPAEPYTGKESGRE